MIKKRGLNPHSLSLLTDGGVSDTAIRNYLKGEPPSHPQLMAIAEAFGVQDGPDLLRAYGLDDMAERSGSWLALTGAMRDGCSRCLMARLWIRIFSPTAGIER